MIYYSQRGTLKCITTLETTRTRNGYKQNESAAVKIFEARLQSKTWDIHGMPHFITTTHHEGCDTCEAYALHVIEASRAPMVEIPSRVVEKAFWIAWLNIVCQIEDEASSELLRHIHICTRSIQIYFCIFFPFICVSSSFHCSHTIPIFSEFFPIFLPILFTSKACHFNMALLILLPFKCPGRHSHQHLGWH